MIQNLFDRVMQDNFSGSGKILEQVQNALLQFPPEEKINRLWLNRQLDTLENHFPHFALLHHFLTTLRNFLENNSDCTGSSLTAFVRHYQQQWENAQQKAALRFLNNVSFSGKNILLHSNSSAIHRLFEEAVSRKIFPVIWQTVSSPANEGLRQAAFLRSLGLQVHLFHEDAAGKFAERIDMAVFGADLLWEDSFLNKIGTFPITLVFNYFQKPVYVLAESRKYVDITRIRPERFRQFLQEKPKPEQELTGTSVENIRIYNYYFETIPLNLITRVFTEK